MLWPNRSSWCGVTPSTARHMKWDYELEDPHLDARGFRAANYFRTPTNRLTTRSTKSTAQFRGNQKRSRAFKRRPLLQRSRTPGIFHARMHNVFGRSLRRTKRASASWRNARDAEIRSCRPASEVRLYKNNTDFVGHSYGCHDNYLMSRDTRVGPNRRRHSAVSRSRARFSRAPERWASKRRAAKRSAGRLSNLAARGFFQRAGEHRHDESPPAHQHA